MKLISFITIICIFFPFSGANANSMPDFPTRSSVIISLFNPANPSYYNFDSISQLGLTIEPNRFGLSQLARGAIDYCFSFDDSWALASRINAQAFDLYSNWTSSVHLANRTSDMICLTAGLDWNRLYFKNYGSNNFLNFNASVLLTLANDLRFAAMIANSPAPMSNTLGKQQSMITFGFGTQSSEINSLDFSLRLINAKHTQYALSLSRKLHNNISANLSVAAVPIVLNVSVDMIITDSVQLLALLEYHQYLAWTSSLAIRMKI